MIKNQAIATADYFSIQQTKSAGNVQRAGGVSLTF
jgi:hypothetical protein